MKRFVSLLQSFPNNRIIIFGGFANYVENFVEKYLAFTNEALQAKKEKRLSGRLENLDTPLSRHVSIRRRTPSQRWQSARRKARVRICFTRADSTCK